MMYLRAVFASRSKASSRVSWRRGTALGVLTEGEEVEEVMEGEVVLETVLEALVFADDEEGDTAPTARRVRAMSSEMTAAA